MPSLFCPIKTKTWVSSAKKSDPSNTIPKPQPYYYQLQQESPFSLDENDMVIVVSKRSKKQISGLALEKQDEESLITVRLIMENSLFAKTSLRPNMEIRVINGIDCSKLRSVWDAYEVINEAQRAITIVARKKMDTSSNNIKTATNSDPKRWSSGTKHMWLEMVDYVDRKSTPVLLSPPKEEVEDEHIEAPPTPSFKKTCRPKALPSQLDVENKNSTHTTMSEITLRPSQHPDPVTPADIVISEPMGQKTHKMSSIKSVLSTLYPDYSARSNKEDQEIENISIVSNSTEEISLTPTSLVREESPTRLADISVPPPPLDRESTKSLRAGGPMESNSLYAPSIPRVGARDTI